jgi:hypothetical protein
MGYFFARERLARREPLDRELARDLRALLFDRELAVDDFLRELPLEREPLDRDELDFDDERPADDFDDDRPDAPFLDRDDDERPPDDRDDAREPLDERELDRRVLRPPRRSDAGSSSCATAFVSCGINLLRKSRMRSSSRRMLFATLAVSLSPTSVASVSIAV